MNRKALILGVFGLAACTTSQRAAWRESGHAWGASGKQAARALGKSIDPDTPDRKEAWKDLGNDLGEAGKDTAHALGKSVTPPEDSERTRP